MDRGIVLFPLGIRYTTLNVTINYLRDMANNMFLRSRKGIQTDTGISAPSRPE